MPLELDLFVSPTSSTCSEAHSSLVSELILTIHVSVDLAHSVTVRDLKYFLECVPENVDLDLDLRWAEPGKSAVRYLGLNIPLARHDPIE